MQDSVPKRTSMSNAYPYRTRHAAWRVSRIRALCVGALACREAAPPQSRASESTASNDSRFCAPRSLDDDFPFGAVASLDEWKSRAPRLRQKVMLAAGIWPTPTKTPLNAVIHGKVEREDYTVEKVFFE